MDSQEHGRSSSSPSVKIEQIVRRKSRRPGQEIEIVLSDASSFFVAMRVWEDSPFHEGDELSQERWTTILRRSALIQARGQALSLLARTEHSTFLLRQKLLQRGYDADVVDAVLAELDDSGAQSDDRFAESWVRSRLRSHPEGRAHLIAGLRARGIDAGLAEEAVTRVLRDESISLVATAREYAERLVRRGPQPAHRLADKLYRRGFATAVVRQVVSEFTESGDGDLAGDEAPEFE